ncbi:MAG: site-specific integrase [Syntrophobacterales bacterium]
MPANPLTRAQVKAVLKQTSLLRDQALLTLGFQTGFRIAELLSLTVGGITDSYGQVKSVITVVKSRMKGKLFSRTVKLNSDTQRVLSKLVKKLKQHNRARRMDALFQSRQGYKGKALGARQVNNIIKELFAKAGCVGQFSSHSLRKTFAEECRRLFRGDILKIQKALGHSDIRNTIRYLSYNEEEILEVIGSISYI